MKQLSIEDLLRNSATYDKHHIITKEDAEKATTLCFRILQSRNENKPVSGDIIICEGPDKIYHKAHIDVYDTALDASICMEPYIPFVITSNINKNKITFDTSGGYWISINEEEFSKIKFVGQRFKLFNAWGHKGACKDGAFSFSCKVNVWRYKSSLIY